MDSDDLLEEASQIITRYGELVVSKLSGYAAEFNQEAIEPATKDIDDLASKLFTQVFQPLARDLGILTREVFDEVVQPAFSQIEVLFKQTDDSLIKPAGKDLRKLHEQLGIAKEIKELYRTLDISSEEEALRILCAFTAVGGTTLLIVCIISHLQSGGKLENFSFFPFLQQEQPWLDEVDEETQNQFSEILAYLEHQIEHLEYQSDLNIWNYGSINIHERYEVKTSTNQFIIDRQVNNSGLSVSDNIFAPPFFSNRIFEIAQLLKDVDMTNFNNNLPGANIGNFANQLNDNAQQQANQHINNYALEHRQTLAEAAKEIQRLLKQLEKTNPTATEIEKVAYINDETTPSFQRRVVGALQAGGEAAIEEFLDNSYVNVGKAIVKGWIKPE
jgi:hypothetical protein